MISAFSKSYCYNLFAYRLFFYFSIFLISNIACGLRLGIEEMLMILKVTSFSLSQRYALTNGAYTTRNNSLTNAIYYCWVLAKLKKQGEEVAYPCLCLSMWFLVFLLHWSQRFLISSFYNFVSIWSVIFLKINFLSPPPCSCWFLPLLIGAWQW